MRILIVEDEESLAQRIQATLKSENYQAEVAFDGEEGLDQALEEEYDLIILDIMLPKIDGIQILKEIRRSQIKVPVLMLTAKTAIENKVEGLDAGADDYLTKPFAIPELMARVRSLMRRLSDVKDTVLNVDNLKIVTKTHEVFCKDELVNLTSKEYAILEFLIYNMNRVVSRLSIAEHVWGDNFDLFSMTNFVDVHIKNLRKKLQQSGQKNLIQTIRGLGYMIKENYEN